MHTSAVPALLHRLTTTPGRPRLTWYGPDGERVELSGHVLDNWVTKTTNLLVEEYDAGPGTHVRLDLPAHWRGVVWALATWRAGAHVVLEAPLSADLVVTHRPQAHVPGGAGVAPGGIVVGVALPALARALPTPPPPGVDDATASVMTYGDALGWVPEPDPGAPAVTTADGTVEHGELASWWAAAAVADAAPHPRTLVTTTDDRLAPALAASLAALDADGSVVLCGAAVTAELAADDARRARLVETERVTAGA